MSIDYNMSVWGLQLTPTSQESLILQSGYSLKLMEARN